MGIKIKRLRGKMKRPGWIGMLLLLFPTLLLAQEEKVRYSLFDAGLIAGFNATQVDGDDVAGYNKLGLNTGATVFVRFHDNISVSLEMLYNQKGSKSELNIQYTQDSYKLWLDYVEVPLMLNFYDKKIAMFSAGLSFARLVRFKEEVNGFQTTDDYEIVPYDDWDYNLIFGVMFFIKEHWGIQMRFAYSVDPVRGWDPGFQFSNGPQRHNLIGLRGMYIF